MTSPADTSDVALGPVPVVQSRRASASDIESAISDKIYEITITKHTLSSPGASIFTNNDLHYNAPVRNVKRISKLVRGERSSLGIVSTIAYATAVVDNQSHLEKCSHGPNSTYHPLCFKWCL